MSQRLTELGPGYPSGLPLTSLYDAVGHRTALQTWRGSQSWGYDALNRSRTLTDIEGGLYTWSYDLHGRLSELDYPNGVIFTATYSSQGWPAQGSYASASTQIELLAYPVVDKVGNPLTLNQYWGGAFQTGRNMSYDAANQLIAWGDSDTSGPAVVLDPAGNPSTAHVGGYTCTYTYDAADELANLQLTTPAFVFFNSATFSYDGNGNRSGEQFYQLSPGGSTVDRTTYTWDPANHLLKIQQSQAGAVDLTNSYRPDGLRHQRTDSSGTTQILWDGDDPLAQVDTSGNLKEFWSWGGALPGGNWSRLAKKHYPATNPNPDQYAHGDWQGTVVALSVPNGTALSRSQPLTRPWGQETAQTPLSWLGNHGYWAEGQLARPMHYVRARWYVDGGYDGNGGAAVAGGPGWLSPDPLGFGGGDWNLYRYVRNRPTVKVDPSGLITVEPVNAFAWELGPTTQLGACGHRHAIWRFRLDNPAPCDGYIVQQITLTGGATRCNGTTVFPSGPITTYWEAWFVKAGYTLDVNDSETGLPGAVENHTDDDCFEGLANTAGYWNTDGAIRFFCEANTGDLRVLWSSNSPDWPGDAQDLGLITETQLATADRPDFWDSAPGNPLLLAESPAFRWARSNWCCCPAGSRGWSISDAYPKPQGVWGQYLNQSCRD